jgi:cation transport regulator ChaC
VTTVNPEAAERIAINDASKELKELGAREMRMSYVPDWQKERMSPEELEKVKALQKIVTEAKRAQAQRKKDAKAEDLRNAATGPSI